MIEVKKIINIVILDYNLILSSKSIAGSIGLYLKRTLLNIQQMGLLNQI
jgi:hypothetical protein